MPDFLLLSSLRSKIRQREKWERMKGSMTSFRFFSDCLAYGSSWNISMMTGHQLVFCFAFLMTHVNAALISPYKILGRLPLDITRQMVLGRLPLDLTRQMVTGGFWLWQWQYSENIRGEEKLQFLSLFLYDHSKPEHTVAFGWSNQSYSSDYFLRGVKVNLRRILCFLYVPKGGALMQRDQNRPNV